MTPSAQPCREQSSTSTSSHPDQITSFRSQTSTSKPASRLAPPSQQFSTRPCSPLTFEDSCRCPSLASPLEIPHQAALSPPPGRAAHPAHQADRQQAQSHPATQALQTALFQLEATQDNLRPEATPQVLSHRPVPQLTCQAIPQVQQDRAELQAATRQEPKAQPDTEPIRRHLTPQSQTFPEAPDPHQVHPALTPASLPDQELPQEVPDQARTLDRTQSMVLHQAGRTHRDQTRPPTQSLELDLQRPADLVTARPQAQARPASRIHQRIQPDRRRQPPLILPFQRPQLRRQAPSNREPQTTSQPLLSFPQALARTSTFSTRCTTAR
jgi:hypothetical protein